MSFLAESYDKRRACHAKHHRQWVCAFPKPGKLPRHFSKARKLTRAAFETHGGCLVLRALRPWVVMRTDNPIGVSLGIVEREKNCAHTDRGRQASRHPRTAPAALD